MPIVGEKKPLSASDSWLKHINKKFGVEEPEEKEAEALEEEREKPESSESQEQALLGEKEQSQASESEELVSLEFLEKPVE